ncbi:MAG TPA: PIN domain-containing protein [Stellaceae bacterium]|nr:PIN domain-containing protein [Stellaceae bacterium]
MTTSSIARFRPRFTLDSNLLVYSVAREEGVRHETARAIVDRAVDADCWLTLQSLSEFYSVSRRRNVAREVVAAQVENWLTVFPSVAVSAAAIRCALADHLGGRASYWDALLVATASEAGCTLVLSEDMSDGAVLSGVRIHKPFNVDGVVSDLTRELLDL